MLGAYRRAGVYTDCYRAGVAGEATLAAFVAAFYTTWVFRLERFILARVVAMPSSDAEARRLAAGDTDRFAAWRVETRGRDQLLMCDFRGRTRSWLMVRPARDGGAPRTWLYFGSAVVSVPARGSGITRFAFHLLLVFHRLYSHVLLYSARVRLQRQLRGG